MELLDANFNDGATLVPLVHNAALLISAEFGKVLFTGVSEIDATVQFPAMVLWTIRIFRGTEPVGGKRRSADENKLLRHSFASSSLSLAPYLGDRQDHLV